MVQWKITACLGKVTEIPLVRAGARRTTQSRMLIRLHIDAFEAIHQSLPLAPLISARYREDYGASSAICSW